MDIKPQEKWYFRNSSIVIGFLCLGPLALPLIWFNPRLSQKAKIIISVIIVAVSYFLWLVLEKSLRSINSYYQLIFNELK